MIKSFLSQELELFYTQGKIEFNSLFVCDVSDILARLDHVSGTGDLEVLFGCRLTKYGPCQYAVTVTVNGVEPNGAIKFKFIDGHACDLDLVQYEP